METRTRDTRLAERMTELCALTAPVAYSKYKRTNGGEILRVLEGAAQDIGFIAEISPLTAKFENRPCYVHRSRL